MDIAGEAKTGKVVEQSFVKSVRAGQPVDFFGREAKIFEKIQNLLEAGGAWKRVGTTGVAGAWQDPDRHVFLDLARASTFLGVPFTASEAADLLSRQLTASGVMVFSHNTEKALLLSKHRGNTPLVALCYDEPTWRRLSLFWGIVPLMVPFKEDVNDQLEVGIEECVRNGIFHDGDTVVVLYGVSKYGANTLKVHQI